MTTESDILNQARALGHSPVLGSEVVKLSPNIPNLKVLDGTFGRGGHANLIELHRELETYLAIDRDPQAIATAKAWSPQKAKVFVHDGEYSSMTRAAHKFQLQSFDLILLDLGVSSPQLDQSERGFSFKQAGPLDMRMNPRKGISAEQLIADCNEEELANIIYEFGEERASRKIAKAIVQHRNIHPINDTQTLARIIESVQPRHGKIHPATRTFQGLRIAVNREIDELNTALEQIPSLLSPGGRAIVISFHSLEDRPVKQAFAKWKRAGLGTLLNKNVITAGHEESRLNPRSRSAKLRAFEKAPI